MNKNSIFQSLSLSLSFNGRNENGFGNWKWGMGIFFCLFVWFLSLEIKRLESNWVLQKGHRIWGTQTKNPPFNIHKYVLSFFLSFLAPNPQKTSLSLFFSHATIFFLNNKIYLKEFIFFFLKKKEFLNISNSE